MSIAFKQFVSELDPSIKVSSIEVRDIIRCNSLQRSSLLAKFDLIVLGGGGLYMPFFPWHRLTWLLDLDQPLILYSLGFNQNFKNPKTFTEEQLNAILSINNKSALSSVRDKPSKEFLDKLGCSSVQVICDPAAAFIPRPLSTTKQHPLLIGVNIPAHGFFNQTEVHRYALPVIAKFLENLSQKHFQLHYMVHHPREIRVVRNLAPLRFKIHNHSPARLASAYHELDLNIGGMLHSSILAFAAGTPFLCLAYDVKQSAFLRLVNCENRVLNLDTLTLEGLSEQFENILMERESISLELEKSKKDLRDQHLQFIKTALNIIS